MTWSTMTTSGRDPAMAMINADRGLSVFVDPAEMTWQESPSRQVLRKRYYLDGPLEAGRVTSLVRYQPGAAFARHDHPEGEEILVLDGVFSDDSGDWPAGTWLLNPEGYAHAPWSTPGCLLFVKLRQYTGTGRKAICVDALHWQNGPNGQYRELDKARRLVRVPAGSPLRLAGGCEAFVLEGRLSVMDRPLGQYCWFRAAPGQPIQAISAGCVVYLHESDQSG